MKLMYVYIMASLSRTIYVGVTNDLGRRVTEHRENNVGFTARYNVSRLVHFEVFFTPMKAIGREKEIKGWRRQKKILLIEQHNPEWDDLLWDFLGQGDPSLRSG
jgi:putative endonuclease